jgi:flagellar biogenesis protein FliO
MLSAIDPALAVNEIPSLWDAALRLGLAVVLLVVAAWGWFAWQRRGVGRRRQLEVVERSFLSRGVSLALIRVDGRRMLVGVSADGVRLIRELGRDEPETGSPFETALAGASLEVGR